MPASPLTGLIPQHPRAVTTEEWIAHHFRAPLTARAAVVQRDPGGISLDDQRRIVETALLADRAAARNGAASGFAVPILNTGKLAPAARENGTTAITYMVFPPSISALTQAERTEGYAHRVSLPGLRAHPTGVLVGELEQARTIGHALRWVEIATLAVIVAILALYFRSIGAPLVTLVSAGLAYVISTHLVTWLGIRMGRSVPREVAPLMVVLLLGVVTDYSVFFMAGMRRRLRAGEARLAAVRSTTAEFLPIIVTAGLLVAAGVATLRVASIHFFQALGPAMAVTVIVGMLVCTTFVPAVLAIFGRAVLWPGLRKRDIGRHLSEDDRAERARRRLARLFSRRRTAAVIAVVTAGALIGAATGLFQTRLGLGPVADLGADQQARIGARQATAGFAEGAIAPSIVLLRGGGIAGQPAQLEKLQELIARQPGIAGVFGPGDLPLPQRLGVFRATRADAAQYGVVLQASPYSSQGIDELAGLQQRMPGLAARSGIHGVSFSYAGDTAIAQETIADMHHDVLWVGWVVVVVNLFVLAVFLRSLVAPLYLVAASLLAVAAAIGLTTYLFQTLLGYGELTYYFPLAAGVLLISFGSDYNVFIVGRIWQRSHEVPIREAVTMSVPRAGRAITTAGVALGLSFATLAIIPLASFAEFAFAMGIGILLDTFLVRSLLLPAMISAVGEGSWWPMMHDRLRARGQDLEAID